MSFALKLEPSPSDRKFERLGVIVGAMKTGTTSLFNALSAHPQICPSSKKETHFFRTAESAAAGLEAYEDHWVFDRTRHAVALEASPSYSKCQLYPGVPERLAATPYDLRLVYVLRNPVARYVSHYIHAVSRDFGIQDIHRDIDPNALNASSYASQLAAFEAHIPRDKILLVRFEDLTKNPGPQISRIVKHFGVMPFENLRLPHLHSSKHHHMAGAIERLRQEGAKPDGKFDAPSVDDQGRIDLRRTFLPAASAARLHDALREDMRKLSEEWGFDVRTWGF
jgi:hypothetical protein